MVDHTTVTAASRPVLADRYELGEILGRGGVADVFSAADRTLGRTVAVKLFRHDDHTPPDTRRVDSEMRTLALLSHPGLVTLFDAGISSDVAGYDGPYLVMELVDGPTLGSFRGGRALTLPATARIGRELADALASMHAAGVVHRDIKPANVLMTRQSSDPSARWTKLTDFGIARLVDSQRLTEHGTSVGTAHYVSPEQALGTVAEPASDVYSLGLVLIECITGRMVFEGSAVASAVARLHRDPAVPGDVGPAWASLLRDMTNRDAAERPDAREVSRRLDALTAPTDLADDTDVLVPPLPVAGVADAVTEDFRHTRRSSSAWIFAAGAVAAAVVVAILLWSGSQSMENMENTDTGSPPSSAPMTTPPPPSTLPAVEPVLEQPAPQQPAPQQPAPQQPAVAPPPVLEPVPVIDIPPASSGNNGNGNGNGNNGKPDKAQKPEKADKGK